MKEFTVEFLDTREHVYLSIVLLDNNIFNALEKAKNIAYDENLKRKIVTRYVSIKDDNEQYVYNMLTKKTEKWY